MMGKLYDRPGRLPTARHGGQVCFAMAEEATAVVVFVASQFVLPRLLEIPKRRFRERILERWVSLSVCVGVARSFQQFLVEMDRKTRTQKTRKKRTTKTRKNHKLDNNNNTSVLFDSASTLSFPLKCSPFQTVSTLGPLHHHEYERVQETSTGT